MSVENMGNGYVKVGVKQEDLEASIAGLRQLKPIFFEVRKNDRPYHTGDYVALNEWNSEQYTGKCTLQKIVYILNDPEYCKEGYVILGLEPCAIGEIRESRRMLQGRSEEVPVYDRK